MASSETYRDRTVQSVLSACGRRVASIYLPMTDPPWPVNGMMISGFPVADERRPPTFPAELGRTLPPFSEHRILSLRYERPDLIDEYLRDNLRRIEAVTAGVCRSRQYDVVLSCLPTPDLAHHYFWRRDDPAALQRIYGYYDEIDAAIGRLVATVDDRTTVVVASDHGGRAAPPRLFGVNRWLADAGDLVVRSSPFAASRVVGLTNRAVNWAKRRRLHDAFAGRLRGALRRRVSAMTHNTAFVDWSRSRAYGLDFFCPLAGVEINLAGRQAAGIVPARDFEPLRRDLIARLAAATDPGTGRPFFSRVARREELFDGPHGERFPDVVGVLTDEYDVKGHLDLPVAGPNHGQADYPYLGYHGRDAFFLARGAGIRHGVGPSSSAMRDLAPTLLALAGIEPPAFVEGRPFDM
jgi:predicted AlkP superfamily phosphohydrolase/phosphomutase